MSPDELPTPHALVDLKRVHDNLRRVQDYAHRVGLGLRPHTKTHKDPLVAQLQIQKGARGLTVATAREAEVMAGQCDDLLVAYPPVDPDRVQRLARLARTTRLLVALDSKTAVERFDAALVAEQAGAGVLVEIDAGAQRTGLRSSDEVVALAHATASSRALEFRGIMVHPGHLRADRPHDELERRMGQLEQELHAHLQALDRRGLPVSIVSGGNTPTLFFSHLVPELTEIRPGTYVYSDRDIASQGVLPWSGCAYSILATVVSTSVSGQVVLDAGTKALAKEPLPGVSGYGALLDDPHAIVVKMSEEHGVVDLSQTALRPQVGDRLRVVPNHVCLSVHLQDDVAFWDGAELEVRPVLARGRRPLR